MLDPTLVNITGMPAIWSGSPHLQCVPATFKGGRCKTLLESVLEAQRRYVAFYHWKCGDPDQMAGMPVNVGPSTEMVKPTVMHTTQFDEIAPAKSRENEI